MKQSIDRFIYPGWNYEIRMDGVAQLQLPGPIQFIRTSTATRMKRREGWHTLDELRRHCTPHAHLVDQAYREHRMLPVARCRSAPFFAQDAAQVMIDALPTHD